MTDEYIRKADVVEVINKDADNLEQNGAIPYAQGARAMAIVVDQMLPADVVPVVHAYWIPQKENNEFKEAWMKCSACGYPVSRWTGNTNFCPDCGAKMDAQREE